MPKALQVVFTAMEKQANQVCYDTFEVCSGSQKSTYVNVQLSMGLLG